MGRKKLKCLFFTGNNRTFAGMQSYFTAKDSTLQVN